MTDLTLISDSELVLLEQCVYDRLHEFYADEDDEYNECLKSWKWILKEMKKRGLLCSSSEL